MTMPNDMIDILICPVTRQPLSRLSEAPLAELNCRITAGGVTNAGGEAVCETLDDALVTENGLRIYTVRDGIPVLLEEEAILR